MIRKVILILYYRTAYRSKELKKMLKEMATEKIKASSLDKQTQKRLIRAISFNVFRHMIYWMNPPPLRTKKIPAKKGITRVIHDKNKNSSLILSLIYITLL